MKRRRFFIIISIFLLIAGFITIGVKETGLWAGGENPYSKIAIVSEVFKHISQEYVDELDNIEILNNAIKGMVDMLDPHSTYINASNSQRMDDQFQGYEGIGISFQVIDSMITVLQVAPSGPSYKVGLRKGDRIIKINGESAIGIKQDDVPKKLKGPRGTTVKVTIDREGLQEQKEFTIVRDKVNWNSIDNAFMLTETIGYINIASFTATTGEELEKALTDLEKQGMKKLILDLRYNSGGYLEAAVEVCDSFLPGGKKIVFTKGRPENKRAFREWYSRDEGTHPFYPMIVMINKYSASASEIVAGAIQDWDRGLIVGETSFGKGLVQTPYRFNDGSSLLLTTARYYTPSGRLIQRSYKGKSREEYYNEARNDSLHKALIEKTEKTDSLMYKTASGRKVFGGGGITPDITIEGKKSSDFVNMNKIFPSGNYLVLFIDFLESYMIRHTEIKKDFNYFLHHFEVNDGMIADFKQFIRTKNVQFVESEMDKGIEDIRFLLKTELASQIWGETEKGKVEIQKDDQLKTALQYFTEAENLLASFSSQSSIK